MPRIFQRRLNLPIGKRARFSSISATVLLLLACSTVTAKSVPAELIIEPGSILLPNGTARQQVAVTARFADGSVGDVSHECKFAVEPETVASVSPDGVVRPRTDGFATLRAYFGHLTAEVEVRVNRIESVRPVSYRTDVVPLLSKAGCNMGACHGNLNGKGGFRLSLRGDDPVFDLGSLTHDTHGRRINLIEPDRSLILLKPTGRLPHEGGLRFGAGAVEAQTLRDWIKRGAVDDKATAPRLTSLRVFPEERISASPILVQQLIVTATFSDGSIRDVTRQASFDISDPTQAEVSFDGLVRAVRPCETTIAVRFLDGRAVSRLAFLANRDGFAWSGPSEANLVDTHVFNKLKALKIKPSGLAADGAFIRRAYLDAIGRLPEPAETLAFLSDRNPDKRSRLIDRLVERPEFADFWALKWADLLRNEEKTMGEKGVWIFQRWLRDQLAQDTPLDELARAIVAGRGSTWQNPPSSFYRTNRDPMTAAETVCQVFLGVRLQCARCHNHPFDDWSQDDYYGLAAYFANIARKQINNVRRDNLDKHEINGDEIIFLTGRPEIVQPRSGVQLKPKPPHGDSSPADQEVNALDHLADWLTRDNAQFTRNLANRAWFQLFGRGIVEPVDDFRASNPPSNPQLLEALSREFVAGGMRLKPLVALIMKSSTYQFDSTPNATNREDTANFARASVRLLPAEVLLDGMGQVLESPETFRGAPHALRATQFPGVSAGTPFLKVFGKPDRLLTCECERSETTTLAQAFQMINGESTRRKLESPDNRIGRLLRRNATDEAILSELYLAALCREPTPVELRKLKAHLGQAPDRRKALEDVAWAILNSKEFLLRH